VLLTTLSLWPSGSNPAELEIVAHRDDASPDFWNLSGRIRQDGDDVSGARVWVIVKGRQGDRDSPPSVVTSSYGQFTFTNLPKKVGGKDVQAIEIHSRLLKDRRELRGLEIFRSGETPVVGTTGPPTVIGLLASLLLVSMLLPFLDIMPERHRYMLSMLLAVSFNFGVIGSVGYALYKVHSSGTEGLPTFGFVSIFRGTYIERGPEQWLVSLSDRGCIGPCANPVPSVPDSGATVQTGNTSPVLAASSGTNPTEKGFGAPLWVVLLAVVGSGIITVSLITQQIRDPHKEDSSKIREKIYNAVQHQVYILFSPICAIFAYQAMVMSNTAGQPLAVALGTLGAGVVLNNILRYAVDSSTRLFTKSSESSQSQQTTQAKAARGGP
jgi:hypothetical protein